LIVLFDLEGTLVETCFERSPEELESMRSMARVSIQEMGIPRAVLSNESTSSGMRNRALTFASRTLPEAYGEEVRRGIRQFMDLWESRMAEGYVLYPETTGVLEDLRSLNCRMGIVTSTTVKNVDVAFRRFGIADYFDAVVTRESVPLLKPDPAGIFEAMKMLGYASGTDFYFVGDSRHDVTAADRAGGVSIGVDRGFSKLKGISPDHVVKDLRGIISIIREAV
jgi:phosphoglycolate phosphatase